LDLTSISQPLTSLSNQCKLPISMPQAMGLLQQAQGGGGLPGLPGGGAGTVPLGGTPGTAPVGGTQGGTPPTQGGTLPGPPRANNVG
jgi:hypothetical protein